MSFALPKHIVNLLLILVCVLLVALLARVFLIDPSFYRYGTFRADAVPELAYGEPFFSGSAYCRSNGVPAVTVFASAWDSPDEHPRTEDMPGESWTERDSVNVDYDNFPVGEIGEQAGIVLALIRAEGIGAAIGIAIDQYGVFDLAV